MQVLVKNSFAQEIELKGTHESFWDPNVFYVDETFSISDLINLSDPLGFSPYYFLDPRVAFLISQLHKGGELFARGLGPVGTVATMGAVQKVMHTEDPQKVSRVIEEYLPHSNVQNLSNYDQVIVFGENKVDEILWKKLRVGGFYLIGSIQGSIEHPKEAFEAFGKLWPMGIPTEFGWRFQDSLSGLNEFELMKIKKLD